MPQFLRFPDVPVTHSPVAQTHDAGPVPLPVGPDDPAWLREFGAVIYSVDFPVRANYTAWRRGLSAGAQAFDTAGPPVQRANESRRFIETLIKAAWDAATQGDTLPGALWLVRGLAAAQAPEDPVLLLDLLMRACLQVGSPGDFQDLLYYRLDTDPLLLLDWLLRRAGARAGHPLLAVHCGPVTGAHAWVLVTEDQLPPGARILPLPEAGVARVPDWISWPRPAGLSVHAETVPWISTSQDGQLTAKQDVPGDDGLLVLALHALRQVSDPPLGRSVQDRLQSDLEQYLQRHGLLFRRLTPQPDQDTAHRRDLDAWTIQLPASAQRPEERAGLFLRSGGHLHLECELSCRPGRDLSVLVAVFCLWMTRTGSSQLPN